MLKHDLALNNLQGLICHKTQSNHSLLLGWKAKNNAKQANYINAKIDYMQVKSKCRFCGDRDETMNQIINERKKLAQKEYKSRYDWVGKVVHWESCKRLKFEK